MSQSPVSGFREGVMVSHYRIVQKLRSGGMGDVYLAEDQILPRVVALKLLSAKHDGDEAIQRRFMREARVVATLVHPNIARIYEAGEDNGQVFIAMEYVDGDTLDERVAKGAPPIPETLQIALQLVSAVEEAHARGIIHRDLKPSNVMLTSRGDVKVLDFGIAKFTDPEAAIDQTTAWKTDAGVVLGTAPYMSPEQALGQQVTHRSDLFSVGAILYQLVTARPPFGGATTADTLFRVVNTQPEPMARFNYDLPPELERIIRKCLEKTPDRRYQSAAELLVDLRNLERDLAIASGPQALAARVGANVSRTRTAIWALVFLAAALSGVVLWKRPLTSAAPVASIAVLPFENDAGPQWADLSDGIADQVIDDLARVRGLRVMARSTSFQYRSRESPRAAGKALRVDAVLTGRVEAAGDSILVSTEIVDVRDGSRIGGTRFEPFKEDLATLAGMVADDAIRALDLGVEPEVRTARINADAYRLYLKGRQQWNTRTPEGLRSALDLFRQSIELEPRFAPAYAGLADTYSLLERYANVPNAESRKRAIAAAEHAVTLDPRLPEAHVSLASVRETYSWDWAGAEREYLKAIQFSPSYATAHQWYSLLLTRLGRFDEAIEEIAIARELDPLSAPIAAAAANIEYYRGDYRKSVQEARAALRLRSDFVQARLQLALSLSMLGDFEGALAELEPIRGATAHAAAVDAIVRGRAGDREKARAFLRVAESHPHAPANAYALAAVSMAAGDRAGAIRWLRAAADAQSVLVGYVAVDPVFAELRTDAQFREILARVGLESHVR